VVQPAHHFIIRYVLFMLPLYMLMVAHGVVAGTGWLARILRSRTSWPMRRAELAAVPVAIALAATLIPATTAQYMLLRGTDWSGMCRYLRANAQAGDTITGSHYYQATMDWCFRVQTAVSVVRTGTQTPDDLAAAGRPAWYVHIELDDVDPALERFGYTEVGRTDIEHPGTRSRDELPLLFPYPISEHPSRLYRGPRPP
jgi:hypothetical protein